MKILLAEYCEGPFHMGWWLYERDRNDGSQNDGFDAWGWLAKRFDGDQPVWDLCVQMGHRPPSPQRNSDDFAEWFAATFTNGLLVEACAGGYSLVEVLASRPRQRRYVIRTVARARKSFAKACREVPE